MLCTYSVKKQLYQPPLLQMHKYRIGWHAGGRRPWGMDDFGNESLSGGKKLVGGWTDGGLHVADDKY